MAAESLDRREALRARLVDAARARIARYGLSALRARDVTADAGCALGGLYTAFPDLDALIIHANAVTIADLDRALSAADCADLPPADRLRRLARAYLGFARAGTNLWSALFNHPLPADAEVPAAYADAYRSLLGHVTAPLAALAPWMDAEALTLRARAVFAAVHGIVAFSVEGRVIGLPLDRVEEELERFVVMLVRGLTVSSAG